MLTPLQLPLDDHDRLADPPLLDSFHLEPRPEGFSIMFIPSEGVSTEQTETLFLRLDSPEGRLLAPLVQRIHRLLQSPVDRIVHSGGGNYTFLLPDGGSRQLDDGTLDPQTVHWLFDTLKHMAQIAECAFAITHAATGRVA